MSTDFGMFADPEPKVYEPDPEPKPEPESPLDEFDAAIGRLSGSFAMFGGGIGVGKSHFAGMMRAMDKMKQSFRGVRPDMVCFDDLEAQIDLGKYFLADSIAGKSVVVGKGGLRAIDARVKLSQESKIEHKSRMGDAKQKGPKGHKRWGNGQHNAGRKGR